MKKFIVTTLILTLTVIWLSGCFALQEAEQASGVAVAPTIALPVATSAPADNAQSDAAAASAGGLTVYTLDPSRSEARFIINEVLRGADTRVVGVTDNVAGQIALDLNNPTAAQIGEIVINARDIVTDNDFRNNAIRNEILLTDSHEFITFTPTEITDLPERAIVGQTYRSRITGDLTIIGQTHSVTFDATVTPISATELQGDASVTITYADWGIRVPLSRVVTAVEDQATLELSFAANAAQAAVSEAVATTPAVSAVAATEVVPVVEVAPQAIAVTYYTPAQTEGPYYPVQKPAEQDNDLTVVAGATGAPAGELLALSGKLYDADGQPVAGAVIEIWQADANGIYLHPQDPKASQRDPNFQSYGETTTAADGSYSFKTILPGLYEPRPRHIHVKVKLNGQELLTTQFYFSNDETLTTQGMFLQNGNDGSALIVDVTQTQDSQGNLWWMGQRDIVLSVKTAG